MEQPRRNARHTSEKKRYEIHGKVTGARGDLPTGFCVSVIDNQAPEYQLRDPVKLFLYSCVFFSGGLIQCSTGLSNDEQLEQWEKLALDLLSCWNCRYAVKQTFVCGGAHAVPHHVDDCWPARTVRMIGK